MKMFLKILGLIVLLPLSYLVGVIVLGYATYYSPEDIEQISENDPIPLQDSTFKALIWNIGYGGLGKDMDFFFDGGQRVRPTPEMHQKYFENIKSFLEEHNTYDFVLLQEVDTRSKRSYNTNEKESLKQLFPGHHDFAFNYKVKHVPLQFLNPLGHVNSGLMSNSKYVPSKAYRFQFPGSYGFPNKLFFLRRCFLQQEFSIDGSDKKLIVINTHNSAYDDGSLKQEEMQFLKEHLQALEAEGHFLLVGGDWNQLPPGFEGENVISEEYLKGWKWAFDQNTPTNRSLEKPFDGTNEQKIIDYYLLSPNIAVQSVKTVNENFENSDHQPVELVFKIQDQ